MIEKNLVKRFKNNPIITSEMPGLEGKKGNNINGPSLIKIPDWVDSPLGKYYLYFAHHGGNYIRLAYADKLEGPWDIYPEGTLHIDQTSCKGHIASPDIFIDNQQKIIRMYFHGPYRYEGEYAEHGQLSFVALSKDGINFEALPEVLGPFYFRVFYYKGYYYAIAKNKNIGGLLLRSKDGLSSFQMGKEFIPRMRHAALLRNDELLYIFYSRMGDKPEIILMSYVNLEDNWLNWEASAPVEILQSEKDYEGVRYPVEESRPGSINKPAHQLRDPDIYTEDDKIYLLYSVAGENGIAIGELS